MNELNIYDELDFCIMQINIYNRINACRKAIGLANKLKTTRKKHSSRCFKNLNKFKKQRRDLDNYAFGNGLRIIGQ